MQVKRYSKELLLDECTGLFTNCNVPFQLTTFAYDSTWGQFYAHTENNHGYIKLYKCKVAGSCGNLTIKQLPSLFPFCVCHFVHTIIINSRWQHLCGTSATQVVKIQTASTLPKFRLPRGQNRTISVATIIMLGSVGNDIGRNEKVQNHVEPLHMYGACV